MPALAIRRYRAADRDAVVTLWERCGLIVSYNDPDRDIALWQASPNGEIFVGEAEGKIVATVCAGHDGHRGNPYYVGVDPDCQGRGYGRRMMRHAEAWLAGLGVPKMNVMIRETNDAVHGFYKTIGYEDTPRTVLGRWLTDDAKPPRPQPKAVGTLRFTVTYLEMTQRPAKRPHVATPHRTHAALLRARHPSVAFYRYLYEGVGEPWLWYERRAIDDAKLEEIISDEGVEIYVFYVDGVPGGYFELDRREPPDIELAFFGLMPEFTGQGLGPYLLNAAVDLAWSYEPDRFWVHTCTLDHPKALSLYQRFGFKPYKQEQHEIPDPRLTGLFPARP